MFKTEKVEENEELKILYDKFHDLNSAPLILGIRVGFRIYIGLNIRL
jgi:hypothetical protein